jgi:hypothetical protein
MGAGPAVMSKKKAAAGDQEPGSERVVIIHLKGSTEYASWLDDLSETTHIAKATLFRVAMAEYAKNHDHKLPPSR